jgi:hypothetical protein
MAFFSMLKPVSSLFWSFQKIVIRPVGASCVNPVREGANSGVPPEANAMLIVLLGAESIPFRVAMTR